MNNDDKSTEVLNGKKRFKFGVMSSEYELYSGDFIIAYVCMSLFIKKNIPIATYEPNSYAFMPKDVLDNNLDYCRDKTGLIIECMSSINDFL